LNTFIGEKNMENESFGGMFADILKNGFKTRRTLAIAIVVPIIVLIIIGYIVTMVGTAEPVTIGVVNNDNGIGTVNAATSIINELKGQTNVTVVSISQADVNSDLKNSKIDAAIIFPSNFTMNLAQKNAQLSIEIEGTDPSKAMLINQAVSTSVTDVAAKSANVTSPLKINVSSLYGTGLNFTNLFMYRFMTLLTLILPLVVALLAILEDKSTGVFQRRAASPIKVALAYSLALWIFGIITSLIILAFITYIMGLTIVGDVWNAALLMFTIALVGSSLGVLFTSITRTKNQAFGLFALVLVLQIIFSGLFITVTKFGHYTQLLSYSLPLTYGLNAMKSVLIRGFTLTDVATDITALAIIIVIALVVSMIGLKTIQKNKLNEPNEIIKS
jgi:ABC-2 type transport system permease protein